MKRQKNEDSPEKEVRRPNLFGMTDGLRAGCCIELHGSGTAIVEGCMGVLSYDDVHVRLGLKKQTLLIRGCDLCIDSMAGQTVCICGSICSVEFI